MTINEAIRQLKEWCDASSGRPITIAPEVTVSFQTNGSVEKEAIQMIENQLDCKLVDSYRLLLDTIGESLLFVDPKYGTGGIQLFSPADVIRASQHIWDEEVEVGSDRFCFVGQSRSMGDYFGFATNRAGPKNFDVFCHEYPPGEYVSVSDELKSWRSFDEYLIRVVESLGENTL